MFQDERGQARDVVLLMRSELGGGSDGAMEFQTTSEAACPMETNDLLSAAGSSVPESAAGGEYGVQQGDTESNSADNRCKSLYLVFAYVILKCNSRVVIVFS